MKRFVIFIILAFLIPNIYALTEDNNQANISGVMMYNIFLSEDSSFLEEINYSEAYFRVLSHPTIRGEYLVGDILWFARENYSKINETMIL